MDTIRDLELSALLLGALDPSRARIVAAEVQRSPALRARLQALEAEMSLRQAPQLIDAWRVPVPSARATGLSVRLSAVATLSAAQPGDVISVFISGVPDPETRAVLVLRRDEERGWQVVFPARAQDWIPASALQDHQGARELMITVGQDVGAQRWAAAFPPLDTAIDWQAPERERWRQLREQLDRAALPIVSWEVRAESTAGDPA